MSAFVGRDGPLGLLDGAYGARTVGGSVRPGLVLVTGEAGIGKTALLTRFTAGVTARGGTVVWGTCWDGDQAPAWWPWTQALRALLDDRPELRDGIRPELAAVVPELVPHAAAEPAPHAAAELAPHAAAELAPHAAADAGSRLRVFDAVAGLLARAAAHGPVVVILDDLQWADPSTVELLRFLAQSARPGALLVVGAYRPHEPDAEIAAGLADLVAAAELVQLAGLSPAEVDLLVRAVAGDAADDAWAEVVYRRSGGHPFFARELCHLLSTGGTASEVPHAVRGVIGRRLARLSGPCGAVLEIAAVAGADLPPDVLADAAGRDQTEVAEQVAEAAAAGVLVAEPRPAADRARFSHDLYRETIYTALPHRRRLDLHHRIALALRRRHERGSPVFPTELARHFAAAVALAGAAPAVTWAYTAAAADTARYAFDEAAGHLARVRVAVADAGQDLPEPDLVGLLTAEADLRLRAGAAATARTLLDTAWTRAVASGRADLIGQVALGLDGVGARFAMPRTGLVAALETAREALAGTGTPAEAQVTAALARQLQHSVPADRPRARPLAERAVTIARTLADPVTLASCLLAQHDTLWTPGTAARRVTIAAEITDLARRAGDPERHAQALLLTASAQLEDGSAAFRATLAEYLYVTGQLRQPRHDYLLATRRAALALLDGDIETGERLSVEAAELGHAVGDSDAGNVRMSQRLEVVRARNDPAELSETAAEAVRWWIGAPAHAHAVAAGFAARAGDLPTARRELDTVLALDDWRTDRSYLWSVFVGELATAAIALGERDLCRDLIDDLLPVADACAVNGAAVCFMGAHAHRIGLLYAAIGESAQARRWLTLAHQTHRRLGARRWEAETAAALSTLPALSGEQTSSDAESRAAVGDAAVGGAAAGDAAAGDAAELRRTGDLWQVSYRGRTALLRDAKGLQDLAVLLGRPGVDRSALELAGAPENVGTGGADPTLDGTALAAYRGRLAALDTELDAARAASDLAGQQRASDERERVLTELRRATRPDGRARPLGSSAAERARKAVTARIRDAIRRISEVLPELGAHLDRTVRTGGSCGYHPYR